MKKSKLKILWPNKITTFADEGDDWFLMAAKAGVEIPTGCLTGSCGACEIDVNGKILRPCICNIKSNKETTLAVTFASDPYWQ